MTLIALSDVETKFIASEQQKKFAIENKLSFRQKVAKSMGVVARGRRDSDAIRLN
jgi:hypothetical protein